MPTLGSVAEKGWSGAVIGGVFTLAAAVIGGIFMLLSKDHPPPQIQPGATSLATSPVSSPTAVLTSPTPTPGIVTQAAPQSAAQPVDSDATVSGVPKQVVPDQQVTMRGSGFPRGGAVAVTFATGPGEDFPLSSSPEQVDSQGRFTFTFTVDSMFCGYSGRINTYDFGGNGQLLTSNPLAVVC